MRILFKIFIVSFIIHKIRDTFLNIRAMNVGCFTHVWFMKIHFHCFFFYIFSSEYSFHQAEEKSVSHKDQLIRPVNNRTTVSFRVNSSKDGINEKLNLKKIAHEKPRLISFKGLLSNWQKKRKKKERNSICNAEAFPPEPLISVTTVQRAVEIQFQLKGLGKHIYQVFLFLLPLLLLLL